MLGRQGQEDEDGKQEKEASVRGCTPGMGASQAPKSSLFSKVVSQPRGHVCVHNRGCETPDKVGWVLAMGSLAPNVNCTESEKSCVEGLHFLQAKSRKSPEAVWGSELVHLPSRCKRVGGTGWRSQELGECGRGWQPE